MNKVSVRIDGVEYQIVGEKEEVEIVKVAQYIDGELVKIGKAAPSLNKVDRAVLTSVNIADKLFDSRKENESLKEELDSLKNNQSKTNDELEKEFDSVLKKLEEAEAKAANGSEDKIKSLELEIKEMAKKVAAAESMATEFQNKAYNLQLNYEELKKGK